MSDVIAILASDLHLSLKSPIARSAETDWLLATKRSLDELRSVAEKHNAAVVVAGDIFDKHDPKPELINFALEHLPKMYCVPGQHDLKNHRLDEIEKTAYYTLVKAGKIYNLEYNYPFPLYTNKEIIRIYGIPWGLEIQKPIKNDKCLSLAVIHHYLYTNKSNSYPGVSEDHHLSKFRKKLKGYDAVVSGDNHISHLTQTPDISIFNAGTFLRRKIDERDYKPQIGLLHSDGTITPHFLDVSKDLWLEEHVAKAKESQMLDVSKFLQELKDLGSDSLDFRDAANIIMDTQKTDDDVREIVLESIETE